MQVANEAVASRIVLAVDGLETVGGKTPSLRLVPKGPEG